MLNQENQKALGLWMLTALVAGNMVGSGIFLLPASLASYGSISLLSWILSAFGALTIALVMANLSRILPRTGGPYAYCREAYGNFVGFQVAYNYWIALWVGNAGIAVAFTGYLSVFWPALNGNPVLTFIVSASLVWILTIINILGIKRAGVVQLVTTVLKFLPLLLIGSLGLLFIQPHNFADFNISGHSNFSAFTSAATLTFWAFVGLESATVPAGNVVDPQRTIPRATMLGVIVTSIIYILSSIAVMGVIPAQQLMHSTSPYADAARVMFGPIGALFVAAGAVVSCFGVLNGRILLQGQIPMAAARDGLFPKAFSATSNYGTPAFGLILTGVLMTLLLLLTLNEGLVAQFTFIILLSTMAALVPYLYSVVAQLILYARDREKYQGKKIITSAIIAILAAVYSFWMIAGAGKDVVFYGALLFFSSVPVYAWLKYKNYRAETMV